MNIHRVQMPALAVQLTEDNLDEVAAWADSFPGPGVYRRDVYVDRLLTAALCMGDYDTEHAVPGDWVVVTDNGVAFSRAGALTWEAFAERAATLGRLDTADLVETWRSL